MTILNEPDVTIVDILRKIAKKYPQNEAMIYHNKKITYSEYYDTSHKFAEKLLCDIGPHARTGIVCTNRPERFFAHIGTMMAGGIVIGLEEGDDVEKIINNLCVDVLIIDTYKALIDLFDVKIPTVKKILYIDIDLTDEITSIGLKNIEENNGHLSIIPYSEFINLDSWMPSFNSSINVEFKNPHSDDIAQIIYNENDTKEIIITHKNIIGSLKSCLNIIQSKSNISIQLKEKYFSHLTLNNTITQLIDMYMPIISSGTVYFPPNQKNILTKETKPTIYLGSINTWNKLLTKIKERQHETQKLLNKLFINRVIIKEIGLDEAKYCIIVCNSSDQDNDITKLIEQFEEIGIELCVMYGMKEVMGPISMGVPGCSKGKGIPVIGLKIDQNTNEISIRCEQLSKKSTTTNSEWLKIGKNGYIDRSGFLFFNS